MSIIMELKGDGKSDDTEAFMKAWQVACSSGGAVLGVPGRQNYLLRPIKFSGPCKSEISVQIYGTIEASDKASDPHWLMFNSVEKLSVKGGGTINGNGMIWWQNSCRKSKSLVRYPCKVASTALTFYRCNNLTVEHLTVKNGQQIHVLFGDSQNVNVSGLTVTAPGDSPNTDGIHVSNTHHIHILNRPWYQGGSGSANNIQFQNILMFNVTNPIIIDQNYCDQATPCQKQKSAVQISNVLYQNINGTSASDVALQFDCSQNFECEGIVLQNIDLKLQRREKAKASCNSVALNYKGDVNPHCP
ncbi:hypothetical protein RJT34_23953 [Clitoria ternatea]|uniref:Polygalacturonase n=1 Tax=Clitoria ternatea TaxID=43366 RepID=A0AAN9FNN8_CLITE